MSSIYATIIFIAATWIPGGDIQFHTLTTIPYSRSNEQRCERLAAEKNKEVKDQPGIFYLCGYKKPTT